MIAQGEGHKELRLITHLEKLDPGKGYENHWWLACWNVLEKIEKHLKTMIEMTGGDPDKCKLKVWGAIPQCYSMQEAFPMDKIVLHSKKLTALQKETLAKFSDTAKKRYGVK
jgi:hypothetical protein